MTYTSNTRFAIYVRKSSVQEDRQELSIESQIKHLQEYAFQKNINVVKIFEDSASAHKINNRPEFAKMLQGIENQEIHGILTWKADRLARNPVEGGLIRYMLQLGQIHCIITPHGQYYPQDNTIMLTLEFGMANQYSLDLSKNIKRGNKTKLKNGGWTDPAPCGYLNDRIDKIIIKDPIRFPQVRKMFDLYLSGKYSIKEICDIATKQWGFTTPKRKKMGGNPMTPTSLHNIFTNPFYYGLIRRSGIIAKGTHLPMITKAEYEEMQQILQRLNKKAVQNKIFTYVGIFKCGGCGNSITAEEKVRYDCPSCRKKHSSKTPKTCVCGFTFTKQHIAKGRWYIYYRCTKYKKRLDTPTCHQPCIRKEQLEKQLLDFLSTLQLNPSFIQWAKNCLNFFNNHEKQNYKQFLTQQQQQLKLLEKRVDRLVDLRIDGELPKKEFLHRHEKAVQAKIELETAINNKTINDEWIKNSYNTLNNIETIQKQFMQLGRKEKRYLLSKILSNPTLKDKKLSLKGDEWVQAVLNIQRWKNYTLEPIPCLSMTNKTDVLKESYTEWWSQWYTFRTFFDSQNLS